MRRGKEPRLPWDKVNLDTRQIQLEKTKSSKLRYIPINDALAALLAEMQMGRGDLTSEGAYPYHYSWDGGKFCC